MPTPKKYLARSGFEKTLDQIVDAAKLHGLEIFADGEWVITVSARRRSDTGTGGEITTLTDRELNEVFGSEDSEK